MRGSFAPALLAASSIGALAAPVVERRGLVPSSFSVAVQPLNTQSRDPACEMRRAANKFGWLQPLLQPLTALEGLLGLDGNDGGDSTPTLVPSLGGSNPGSSSGTSSLLPSGSGSSSQGTTSSSSSTAQSTAPATSTGESSGNVAANPSQDGSEYLSAVSIGGQTLNLDFDTGSADLWVFSSKLDKNEVGQHTVFDPSKSKTWSNYQGASWQISYGDGSSASGSVGYDQVQVGSAVFHKQAVELADRVSPEFVNDANNDGLLGLAFSSLNTVKPQHQQTWFENIKDSLAMPVFTANLEEDRSGSYDFGSIDSSKYTGEIHYAPVNAASGFWQFSSPTFQLSGNTYKCHTCNPAIADTGTSLLLMDADIVSAYYNNTSAYKDSNSGFWVYPCESQLPDLGVAIGPNFSVTLPGSAMEYAVVNGTCFSGLQESPTNMQIFGDVLLRHFFAVFDGTTGAERFGLAQKPSGL